MVALLVLSVAFSGFILTLSAFAKNTQHIYLKFEAEQLAKNIIIEKQIGRTLSKNDLKYLKSEIKIQDSLDNDVKKLQVIITMDNGSRLYEQTFYQSIYIN